MYAFVLTDISEIMEAEIETTVYLKPIDWLKLTVVFIAITLFNSYTACHVVVIPILCKALE